MLHYVTPYYITPFIMNPTLEDFIDFCEFLNTQESKTAKKLAEGFIDGVKEVNEEYKEALNEKFGDIHSQLDSLTIIK